MNHILLVEDDASLIDGLYYTLVKNNFDVQTAQTVHSGLSLFYNHTFDLLLLDLTLPDGTGFDICKAVRQSSDVPIIFLTASDEEVNVVMGLDMGGDDYITKPFKLNELISRINALLRRSKLLEKTNLQSGSISMDLTQGLVLKNGKSVELTALEYRLLNLFLQNPNRVLSRETLLNKLWDNQGDFVDNNTLSVYVRRLREKIEEDPNNPQILLTVRRIGYKWLS